MNSKNRYLIISAISALVLLLIAYSNHFGNSFHFDDSHAIVDNVHIRTLSKIPQYFWDPTMFSSSPNHYGVRPIVTTSLAIDYWLGGGLNPFYFHLSTFLWHILLCSMLFFMYRRILNTSIKYQHINYIALFAASWFAVHTVNAETINYIISRSDVLSTCCIVASFLIYIAYPEKRKWFLYIIPAIVGVFAKETVLVLIILLFFYILLFEKNLSIPDLFKSKNFKAIFNTVVMLLPLLLVVLAVQVYTLTRITSIPGISNPIGYYWLTQSYVWLYYFTSFFLPTHLSADTDLTVILSVGDKRILIGLLFVLALVVAIIKTSKRTETKPVSFGLIWFIAALLPTSVAPFAEVMNDHRMYFAFVGLALSVVSFISLWLIKREEKISSPAYPILIVCSALLILSLNAYGVYQRNKVWLNEETLWKDVVIKSPLNGRGLMNYGLTQVGKGNFYDAIAYYESAKELIPAYSTLYTNIGVVMGAFGHNKEAEENFLKGIFYGRNSFEAYGFYARYLKDIKRFDEAKSMGEIALRLNPQSPFVLYTLMEVYKNLNLWTDLERTSLLALSILPGDVISQGYLLAAKEKKTTPKITDNTIPNVEFKAEDYLNLSLSFYNIGNYKKCIEYCEKAIALKPNYSEAYSNIAASYNKLEQWEKGIEASKRALKIDPKNEFAKGNLDWALSQKN